MNPPTCFSSK